MKLLEFNRIKDTPVVMRLLLIQRGVRIHLVPPCQIYGG